ncbi:pyrroloquinoline quinone biosynthesis protein B [Goodfellowiella coeruleoviolacea]|uniref:Coenzyme PQQ synthesis protein B n=1 Tax=Goodfellowiella coeruleoviolacea TaxID=334858 RepID=A0AAE3GB83_9PSEU|nr:pyrroloquinoline quinone biosynthesis protein B [Goodfellowiella coeruleoviolacea]
MRVRVLGSAAGGGVPQWNCACAQCTRARRQGAGAWRGQDALAVAGSEGWFLVNVSPDVRAQVLATPELAPGPGRRQTPLRGVLLTDAELDHTLGIAALREGSALDVHASPVVLRALTEGFPVRTLLAGYGGLRWHAVLPGQPIRLAAELTATPIALGHKRPRYAAALPAGPEWVLAYRFHDTSTGGVLVYAPGLAEWSPAFDAAVAGADWVILDGTFWRDEELAHSTGERTAATARQMGHLPIGGEHGSLRRLAHHPSVRFCYTHLNNTNPVLDAAGPERAQLTEAGAQLAEDGQLLTL